MHKAMRIAFVDSPTHLFEYRNLKTCFIKKVYHQNMAKMDYSY